MSKLKPCPCCGENPSVIRTNDRSAFFVVCLGDHTFGFAGKTIEEAAQKWNEADEEALGDDLP